MYVVVLRGNKPVEVRTSQNGVCGIVANNNGHNHFLLLRNAARVPSNALVVIDGKTFFDDMVDPRSNHRVATPIPIPMSGPVNITVIFTPEDGESVSRKLTVGTHQNLKKREKRNKAQGQERRARRALLQTRINFDPHYHVLGDLEDLIITDGDTDQEIGVIYEESEDGDDMYWLYLEGAQPPVQALAFPIIVP